MKTQDDLINELLEGKAEPPSEIVKYFLEQLKMIQAEMQPLSSEINKLKSMLKNQEVRLVELLGIHKTKVEDLRIWLAKAMAEETLPGLPKGESKDVED